MGLSRSRHVILISGWALLIFAALTSAAGAGETMMRVTNTRPLAISEAKTPPLHVPNYHTSGSYPVVVGVGVGLPAVNAALRDAVLNDEVRYAAQAREAEKSGASASLQRANPGVYQTSPELPLISASTVVVSALIPTLRLFPAGTEGAGWLAVTVRVATGRSIPIGALFANSRAGLRALAAAARTFLLAKSACVRGSLAVDQAEYAPGFAASASNFRYFALTPSGVALGFPFGQVGGCRVEVMLPYSAIRPYLNSLGEELIAGVRQPEALGRG